MKYQRENVTKELCEELKPLLEQHYEEIAHYKDIELNPAWDEYLRIDQFGLLRVYTVRNDDNTLIGYSIYFVKHNLHYSKSLQAVQDILFIEKKHRGRGARFLMWCDNELKKEGVEVVYHHVKIKHNFGPLLERLGYTLVDLIYGKKL